MSALKAYKHVLVSTRVHLRVIQFNRPEKRNAINNEMYYEVVDALNDAANDDNIVIAALTGTGEFYSSGSDLGSFHCSDDQNYKEIIKEASSSSQKFISAFIDFPKILAAVVNGPAIGIAATTLGLCDVVYASDKATFATPFSSLGVVAEGCSTYTFPRLMGQSKASEMLYFNKNISANEAKERRLVGEVFSHGDLTQKVWPILEEMSKLPSKSLWSSKALVRDPEKAALHAAAAAEDRQMIERWQSEEFLSALAQFIKRKSRK